MSRFTLDFIPDRTSIQMLDDIQTELRAVEYEIENQLKPSREKALAITKLQECYHWAKDAIRADQIERNKVPFVDEEAGRL